ncbi:hypothetical protein MVEN_02148600 [Mycena venus]|uniref:Uncharacterized protein n=1 Tax=Mycena venus TaxID=2733690 RepID=A0A8H6X9G4_9AGAR|nr:hypothetical protein MVEN_02148600 [Mycena venus]
MMDHIGRFMETLHKLLTFVEAQQDKNKIKRLFRQGEMKALLTDCKVGLDQAFTVFEVDSAVAIFSINEMKEAADLMQKQLLESISMLSDGTISEEASVLYPEGNGSQNSSNSFSIIAFAAHGGETPCAYNYYARG